MRILIETEPARSGWQLIGRIFALVLVLAILTMLGVYLLLRETERIEPLIQRPAVETELAAHPQTRPAALPEEYGGACAPLADAQLRC